MDKALLDSIQSDSDIDDSPVGRLTSEPDPVILAMVQANIGKGIRLPRMSLEEFEKKVRPEFTRAANKLGLLPFSWRDMQGRWYTVPRTQDKKAHRTPLSPEAKAAAVAKAQATKKANKAAKEAAEKAATARQPTVVSPQARKAS